VVSWPYGQPYPQKTMVMSIYCKLMKIYIYREIEREIDICIYSTIHYQTSHIYIYTAYIQIANSTHTYIYIHTIYIYTHTIYIYIIMYINETFTYV
jgi:hypothetical protein